MGITLSNMKHDTLSCFIQLKCARGRGGVTGCGAQMFGECLFSKILHRLQNMRNYHPRPVLAAAAGGRRGGGESRMVSDCGGRGRGCEISICYRCKGWGRRRGGVAGQYYGGGARCQGTVCHQLGPGEEMRAWCVLCGHFRDFRA